jgi:hypothetical protein
LFFVLSYLWLELIFDVPDVYFMEGIVVDGKEVPKICTAPNNLVGEVLEGAGEALVTYLRG